MRVLVTGDRNWTNQEYIYNALAKVNAQMTQTVVIHGCARGADSLAGIAAKQLGMQVIEFPAQWGIYHRAAGPIRNQQMLVEGKPDICLAFHPNLAESKGTADMVRRCRKANIPVVLHTGFQRST